MAELFSTSVRRVRHNLFSAISPSYRRVRRRLTAIDVAASAARPAPWSELRR